MKTLTINRQRINLYTIADLARALGINPHNLWEKVRLSQTFDAPTARHGRRDYYTEEDYRAIIAAHAEPVEPVEATTI